MDNNQKIQVWNMDSDTPADPQLTEIKHQQAVSGATSSMQNAVAKEALYDVKAAQEMKEINRQSKSSDIVGRYNVMAPEDVIYQQTVDVLHATKPRSAKPKKFATLVVPILVGAAILVILVIAVTK